MSSPPVKMKVLLILAENSWKTEMKLSARSALFHMETRVSLRHFVSYCGILATLEYSEPFYNCILTHIQNPVIFTKTYEYSEL